MPSAEEITRHHDPNPDEDPWVHGPPPPTTVTLVAYDPSWPDRYAALAGDIRAALGDIVLDIEHVGSTAVPDLAAKDQRYENAKRAAVPGGGHVMDYNARKQDTIREIYDRLFRAAGMLP
jgi:hypothetical protein